MSFLAPEADEPHGYPSEFFVGSIEPDLKCAICDDVARDPPNLEVCPHLICRICITKMTERRCPLCLENFATAKLASMPIVTQRINNLPIRCSFHSIGCEWTGILGASERVISEHLQQCKHGQHDTCEFCKKRVPSNKMEQHLKDACSAAVVTCEHCQIRLPRLLMTAHTTLGQVQGRWCENAYKCGMFPKCGAKLQEDDRDAHFQTCDMRTVVCEVCEPDHLVPAHLLRAHLETLPPLPFERMVEMLDRRTRFDAPGGTAAVLRVGDLVDYRRSNEIEVRVGRILHLRTDGGVPLDIVRDLEDGSVYSENFQYARYGTWRSRCHANTPMASEVNSRVRECLMAGRCTICVIPRNHYDVQPYFRCITCNPDDSNGQGCCVTCATVCHDGHKLELEYGGFFCDCGCGDMRRPCKANRTLPLGCSPSKDWGSASASDSDEADMDINVSITSDDILDFTAPETEEDDSHVMLEDDEFTL